MSETVDKTILNPWHRERGANMVDFGGWDMPLWYQAGAVKEHLAVIRAAGLFDTGHMSVIRVEGPGAFDLLQLCFTKDLAACVGTPPGPLVPGRCVYGVFLDEAGRTLDDAIVYRLDASRFMVVVNAGMGGPVAGHLASQAGGLIVRSEDLTGRLAKMDLQGPLSARILKKVLKDPEKVFQNLPYFSFKGHFDPADPLAEVRTLDGAALLLSRTGYTGEFGFEVFVRSESAASVWEAILAAGESSGLIPCGLAARDSLRAGAVLPLSHQDIGAWPFINHPWSFALPLAADGKSFTKRFIGREALLEAFDEDHTLAFVGYDPRKVALHGPDGEPAEVLDADGNRIGRVLTCVADMALGREGGRVFSVAENEEGRKARGLVCGFVRVKNVLHPGTVVILKDDRRKIEVEITRDVRPHRTARRPMKEMV